MAMAEARSTAKALKDVTNEQDVKGVSHVLQGLHFSICGRFSLSKDAFKDLIERHGGKFSATVTQKVTHLITTETNIALEKRPAALATAFGRQLPMVSEHFVHRSIESKTLMNQEDFSLVADEKAEALERTIRQRWCRMLLKNAFHAVLFRNELNREAATRLRTLRLRELVGGAFDFWCETSEKIHEISAQIKKMEISSMLEAEKAFASLQKDEKRVRILLDTNVLLRNELDNWRMMEVQHGSKMKFFIAVAVFDEIDSMRKSKKPEVAAKAREVFNFLVSQRDGRNSNWEMQSRDADAPYRSKHRDNRQRSADLRFVDFARDCNRVRAGAVAIVSNDQPVLFEASKTGNTRTLPEKELLSRSEFALSRFSPPCEPGRNTLKAFAAAPAPSAHPPASAPSFASAPPFASRPQAPPQPRSSSHPHPQHSNPHPPPPPHHPQHYQHYHHPPPPNPPSDPRLAARGPLPPPSHPPPPSAFPSSYRQPPPLPPPSYHAPPPPPTDPRLRPHNAPLPPPPHPPPSQPHSIPSSSHLPPPPPPAPASAPLPPPSHPPPPAPSSSSSSSSSSSYSSSSSRPKLTWPSAASNPPPGAQNFGKPGILRRPEDSLTPPDPPAPLHLCTEAFLQDPEAGLPPGWHAQLSQRKGLWYYVSPEGQSQWEHPFTGRTHWQRNPSEPTRR